MQSAGAAVADLSRLHRFPARSCWEVPGLLPGVLYTQHVFPPKLENGVLDVAMTSPQDPFVIKALQTSTGLVIQPHLALEADVEKALQEPEPEAAEDDEDGLFW